MNRHELTAAIGGASNLAAEGITLHALFTMTGLKQSAS